MPQLKNFKAILFDVDRTLTNTEYILPENVIKNLKQLSQLGLELGICTGRGWHSVINYILPHFPDNSLHILSGGGEISSKEGEVIYQQAISSPLVADILNLPIPDMKLALSAHQHLYCSQKLLDTYQDHPWKPQVRPLNEYQNETVSLIYLTDFEKENIDKIPNKQQLEIKVLVNNRNKPHLDITAKNTDKATALKIWSKQTGIKLEEVIGFGDSLNDTGFLQSVGLSVAMGNANPKIKALANRTIEHVDNNGLSNYLTQIISGKEL